MLMRRHVQQKRRNVQLEGRFENARERESDREVEREIEVGEADEASPRLLSEGRSTSCFSWHAYLGKDSQL